MYGLAAIQQANGWTMAAAGACIVIAGLAILAFLISLLPRLISVFEPTPAPTPAVRPKEERPAVIVPDTLPADVNAAATIFIPLTEEFGEAFSLVDLHRKAKEVGIPHPHFSINQFRDAGILISSGDCLFSWKLLSD